MTERREWKQGGEPVVRLEIVGYDSRGHVITRCSDFQHVREADRRRRHCPRSCGYAEHHNHLGCGNHAHRAADGPMADHVGLFESMTDEQRVVVLLDLLGRKVRVELALEDLAVPA